MKVLSYLTDITLASLNGLRQTLKKIIHSSKSVYGRGVNCHWVVTGELSDYDYHVND